MMHRTSMRAGVVMFVICLIVSCAGATKVYANQSPQVIVQDILPSGGGTAGQPMSFEALASGFTDPTYAMTDDFSGSSVSSGDISNVGYFSWTPAVGDAGTHHVTVMVTDVYNDAASTTALLYVIPNTIAIQNLLPGTQAYSREPVTFTVYTPGFVNPSFTVRDSLLAQPSPPRISQAMATSLGIQCQANWDFTTSPLPPATILDTKQV